MRDKFVFLPSKDVPTSHEVLLKTSETTGHTGLIEAVAGGKLTTIEGNTNDTGSREGIGVFRRQKRRIGEMNLGFVEYS